MSSHASLSAASNDRKARLAALKNLKRKAPADEEEQRPSSISNETLTSADISQARDISSDAKDDDIAARILSGRNYDPQTKGPKLGFEAPPTESTKGPTLEQAANVIEADLRAKALEDEKEDQVVDLFKLQPKKPNWDLKRDLDKKLEILNVRTDNAIAQLVRDRIEGAKKAAREKKPVSKGTEEEEVGMDGIALVEGLRELEREDEEAMKKEKEDEELV